MFSPQPGLPRRQIPYTPFALSVVAWANLATSSYVGFSGMVTPAFWNRSFR